MIVSRIIGGLGNQLFQYAFGYIAAECLGTDFHYEDHSFSLDRFRKPRLGKFQLSGSILPNQESRVTEKSADGHSLAIAGLSTVFESQSGPNLTPDDVLDNSYLIGYWQAHDHIRAHRSQFVRQFQLKERLAGSNLELVERIQEGTAIGVHVRRGDYASIAKNRRIHGLVGTAYYKKAVADLLDKFEGARVFVFSDDPAWCRHNLSFSCPTTFIDHNGSDADYEELVTMSACDHFVIANSTFSWWAAFLSESPTKVVIAPDPWFSDNSKPSARLLPPDWHVRRKSEENPLVSNIRKLIEPITRGVPR